MSSTVTLTFAASLTSKQRKEIREQLQALSPAPSNIVIARPRPPARMRPATMHLLAVLHHADQGEGVIARNLPFQTPPPPQQTVSAIYSLLSKACDKGDVSNTGGYYRVTPEGMGRLRQPDNLMRMDAEYRTLVEVSDDE